MLFGNCDDLSIPRPLGPIRDLVGTVSPPLEQALAAGAAPHEIQSLLIAELELPPQPTVLVLEDVHWADDATLDSIIVLGRRVGSLPALVVLTFRGGEAPPAHPLRAALGAIRAGDSVFLELAPLSEDAVASLAGDDTDDVYAATAGNPFYVTELLGSRPAATLPPSVANAVLGRASRLDDDSWRLVQLVSVVPNRVATSLLDAVMPSGWRRRRSRSAGSCSRSTPGTSASATSWRGTRSGRASRLPRGAASTPRSCRPCSPPTPIRPTSSTTRKPPARRTSSPSTRSSPRGERRRWSRTGRRTPTTGAPRTSSTVSPCSSRRPCSRSSANAAYVVARLEHAFPAIERAIVVYGDLGDPAAVGRCTRLLSRFHWFAGDGDAAQRTALEAVAILEPLGESAELARAYSGLSQLAMLAENAEQAFEWGERALELAIRLGDESTRAHALINIGTAKVQLDHRETATLLEAHAIADAAGDWHEATRALVNLAYTQMLWVQPDAALRSAEQALAYAQQHEIHALASYIATMIAWLRLRAGEWDEAERATRSEIERGITVVQLIAKTVLAELAVRRGDPDAAKQLAGLAAQADRTDELQRLAPVVELETEWALTRGGPMPVERFGKVIEKIRPRTRFAGWGAIRAAAWGGVAGIEIESDEPPSAPLAAMLRRDWLGAADAFGEVGWAYDRALMLSLLDDEDSLAEAIEIARGLGAEPLTRRVAGRMRELGLSVPRAPREPMRANSAGLTARQLEVLSLLAEELTNAEIADRLVVSPRTVEHHVAAVLTKLGAATRRDAARRASELGLVAKA